MKYIVILLMSMNSFAFNKCDKVRIEQTGISISLSISENLALLRLISPSQNKVAYNRVCKYLEGDIALAETILLMLTLSDSDKKNIEFKDSEIGKQLKFIFEEEDWKNNPVSGYLSKRMKKKLGYGATGLFDAVFAYQHSDYVSECLD